MNRRILGALAIASSALPGGARAEIPYADQITPGELRGITMDPGDPWMLGYWEYLPADFDDLGEDERLPLLVFLPGIGEYDDDSTCPGNADLCAASDCGSDGLCRNLTWGPQSLVVAGTWDDTQRPFIVVSPQNSVPPLSTIEWDIPELDAFLQFVVDNYPVDTRRMYLTGMSQGGRGTLQYVAAHPRRFAAAAPMPGGVVQAGTACAFQDTALWAFHGEDDQNGNLGAGTFNPCAMVDTVRMYDEPDLFPQFPACVDAVDQPRPDGRITMFYDVAHSAWIPAIDPVGAGFPALEWADDQGCGIDIEFREYSAALDPDGVYSWMLALDRPDVVAPADVVLPGDATETVLEATVIDDDAVAFTWTQTAGPAATLVDPTQAMLVVQDLEPLQAYTFEVLGVDADDQWDRDEVTVTVLEAPPGESSGSESASDTATDAGSDTTASDDAGTTTSVDGTTGVDTSDATSASSSSTVGGSAEASAGEADSDPDDGDSESSGATGSAADADGGCGCDAGSPRRAAIVPLLAVTVVARRRSRTPSHAGPARRDRS